MRTLEDLVKRIDGLSRRETTRLALNVWSTFRISLSAFEKSTHWVPTICFPLDEQSTDERAACPMYHSSVGYVSRMFLRSIWTSENRWIDLFSRRNRTDFPSFICTYVLHFWFAFQRTFYEKKTFKYYFKRTSFLLQLRCKSFCLGSTPSSAKPSHSCMVEQWHQYFNGGSLSIESDVR